MTHSVRRLLTAGLASATVLALAGCNGIGSKSSGSESSESGPIKIAAVIPLSGSSAPTGKYMQNGMTMAADEINAAGGVNGRKIQMDFQDEACDPTQATAAANKAVSNGDVISVGGYCSGATLPTLPIFNKAKVPMIIPAANSQELVAQKLPNVFLINGTGAQQSKAAVTYFQKIKVASVALADDNTSYSSDIADQTDKDLKSTGIKVALKTSVTAGESDYSSLVNQVKKANPALFYYTGYYQEAGLIINQLKTAGYKGQIMVGDGSVDPSIGKIAGGKATGVLATMTPTPDTLTSAEAKKWIASYTEKFKAQPGPYSTQSYDAVKLAAEAIKQAGGTDGTKVEEALMKIDGYKLFSGPLKFTPEHTLSSGGFQILQYNGKAFVLKDPLS